MYTHRGHDKILGIREIIVRFEFLTATKSSGLLYLVNLQLPIYRRTVVTSPWITNILLLRLQNIYQQTWHNIPKEFKISEIITFKENFLFLHLLDLISHSYFFIGQSRQPHCLRSRFVAARLQELLVRIPPGTWMMFLHVNIVCSTDRRPISSLVRILLRICVSPHVIT